MAHDSEWMASLKIKAEAEMSSVEKSIEKIQKKLDDAKVTYKNRLDTFGNDPDNEYIKKSNKEIEKYEKQLNAAQLKRTKIEENYKMQVLQNEREITRQIEVEEEKRAKAALKRKEELLELQKLNKQIINSDTATKDEKKQARKRYKDNKDEIRLADGDIKTYGTEELQKQNVLLDQRNQAERISIDNEQRKLRILEEQRQTRAMENQAYNEALKLAQDEFTIKKRIHEIESKKNLTDDDKQKLQVLKEELAKVQELKQKNREIISDDKTRVKNLSDAEARYERMLQILNTMSGELDEQNSKTKKIGKSLGDGINNIFKYMLAYKAIGAIESGMRNAIETIRDLDKAFTDIQLVTQQTKTETVELSKEYNQLAKEMSSTTQEVAEGATEWLRQGYNLDETQDLLRSTMVLSKVGAIESSEATQLLTSSLNGMKMEAKDAMSIVDKVSAVDLAAATSSEELMVALSRTASSAEMAGVSFDKLLGMIGTVSSVTRKSASTIGESFKTIFARLQNVKSGVDVDEEGEALNDVEKVLNKMGIRLRKSQTEWRDMEEVIDEVSKKWEAYTEIEKSQIATAIAGTRQRDNFLAMMSHYKEVVDLTKISLESAGSAEEKFAIYQDSLEAKINEVKAAWEGFLIDLNQSDSLKGMMDFVIFLINNLPRVISLFISLAASIKAFSFANKFREMADSMKSLNAVTEVANTITNTNTTTTNANTTAKNVNKAATIGLTTAMSALSAVIGIVAAAFSIAQMAILSYEKHMDELKGSITDGVESLNTIQGKMKNLDSATQSITGVYENYNNKVITLEEKNNELKNIESELISIYGEKAKSIDLVNASYEQQLGIMDNLKQQNLQEQLVEIQKMKGSKEELLNREVDTVMGKEDNFYGASYGTRERIRKIVEDNNMQLTQRIFTDQIAIVGKAKDQINVYKELLAYQKELNEAGKEAEAQRVANMLDAPDFGGVWGMGKNIGMKKEYEKSGGDAVSELLDSEDIVSFQTANAEKISEYEKYLNTRNTLIEQFNNKKKEIEDLETQKSQAKTQKDKENLDLRINNAKDASNKIYDSIVENQDKAASAYSVLMDIVGDNEDLKKKVEKLFSGKDTDFFKVNSDSLNKLKDISQDLYNDLKKINNEFNSGKIGIKQYFDTLNSRIAKIDVSKKVAETKNGVEDLKNTIAGLFGNNISYFDSFIGDLFEDKLTDEEDVKNLQAYSTNLSSMIGMLKQANAEGGALEGQIDKSFFSGDGLNAKERQQEIKNYRDEIVKTGEEITNLQTKQSKLATDKEYDVSFRNGGSEFKAKYKESSGVYDIQNEYGGKVSNPSFTMENSLKNDGARQYKEDMQKLTGEIENAKEEQESLNACIEDLETGEGLDKYMSDLDELGKVLEDMNIEDTQNAFDTLAEGINSGAIDDAISSIDKLPEKYRSAFLEVADDVVYALGSSSEEVRKQGEQSLQNLIGSEAEMMLQTVDFANLSKDQMNQVATDIANKAIIAQGGVTSALLQFAKEGNAIASTAMGQAVQTLGIMLEKIGTALGQIHVSVPVKIPKVQMHLESFITGGDLFQMPRTRRKYNRNWWK